MKHYLTVILFVAILGGCLSAIERAVPEQRKVTIEIPAHTITVDPDMDGYGYFYEDGSIKVQNLADLEVLGHEYKHLILWAANNRNLQAANFHKGRN